MKVLQGKVAMVTGAARGIGRAYALRLATLGADVVVTDINLHSSKEFASEREQMTADTVAEEVRQRGVRSAEYVLDVSDPKACRQVMDQAVNEFGRVDILICNAGGGSGNIGENNASELNLDDTYTVMNRNLYGTINTCLAAAPYMKRQKSGKIVTVTSVAGIKAQKGGRYAHYGVAKTAIVGYTRYLAQDLGPYGIQVDCIAPGYIQTGRLNVQFEMLGKEKIASEIPLRRLGTVDDVANVVEFLSTPLSDYVTGQVISVCGGIMDSAY